MKRTFNVVLILLLAVMLSLLSNQNVKAANTAVGDQAIFKSGDATNANYFRIPVLYTLDNGKLIASADARYGGTHDAKSKINIATSISEDGNTWSTPTFALQFHDYDNQLIDWPRDNIGKNKQIQGSASFIDSAILQDKVTHKIFLMADTMPAGVGNNNALKNDSGFKQINGKYYLKLRLNNERDYNYSIREDGLIFDDKKQTATEYKVDQDYHLLKNNEYLYVSQYSVKFNGTQLQEYHKNKKVKMNIFYKDALFKVTPTNYLSYTTSMDGQHWEHPTILPPLLGLNHNATYLSPGQGLATSNGRLIFSSYMNQGLIFIYSDDHGLTWHSKKATLPFANATAEAQMIELQPNVIRVFLRTTTGKIGYMTSLDNGNTWDKIQYLSQMNQTRYGTQISVIKYSQKVDGKDIIILSTPNSIKGRNNGQIWIGWVDHETLDMKWIHHHQVNGENVGYSYSALTETPNHKVALLYEKYDSWSRNQLHLKNTMKYRVYEINDLLSY
ncbi:sialidase family protein [Staphylococcus lutrae]|uniref:exo-alpha-sialidase n=2 Tax=Staphylococcus lutrae TaxID=155085 RepID=A0AAC9RR49_9STAP|nr:exo-alpha-sialidase [Staphylococcus lutrae]ARJ50156.1 sialidase [Staphylococcus lutrae]PNZ39383.1 sialidase [Staphylococcus lutrae]